MSGDDETLTPKGNARFGTTRWSMVIRAGNVNAPDAGNALEELCKSYWYPLYVFVRKTGKSEEEAKDLTREFFCRLLGKKRLNAADPARGKFLSFLLSSIKNMMLDEWKKGQAQKRGGGQTVLSIDEEDAEGSCQCEPKDETTPEKLLEKRWAQTPTEADEFAYKCEEGCQVDAASAEMFRQDRVAYPVERMTGRSQVRAPFGLRR